MPTLTPYVMVENARAFMTFLDQAFHAEIGELVPLDTDPDRVIHGVAKVGDTSFLDDPVSAYERGVAAGARSALPVTDQGDGTLFGGFVDPFGTLWWLTGTK